MNVVKNAVGIMVILFFAFILYLTLSIMSNIYSPLASFTNATLTEQGLTSELLNENDTSFNNIQDMIKSFYDFVVIFSSAFVIYSSFTYRYNFSSFIVLFIASVMVSGIIYYLFATIYATIFAASVEFISFSEVINFYIQNIGYVLLLNILGFLTSWIFSSRTSKNQTVLT